MEIGKTVKEVANSGEVSPRFRLKRYVREPLARFKAWLDIHILHTRPHFEK